MPPTFDVQNATSPRPRPTTRSTTKSGTTSAQPRRALALEHANEGQARNVVSTATHDLRGPLSVILVSARLLLRVHEADPTRPSERKRIEAIGRAADELRSLVEDLADAASLEASSIEAARESIELRALLAQAIASVEPSLRSRPTALRLRIAPKMPRISGDRVRLAKALRHLLLHAGRTVPKGSALVVSVGLRAGEASIAIGEAATKPDRCLPLGSPALAVTEGLGFHAARGIIQAHGGRITLSKRGLRVGWRVDLPIDTARATPALRARVRLRSVD